MTARVTADQTRDLLDGIETGGWTACPDEDGGPELVMAGHRTVARVVGVDRTEGSSTGALIAAAPDLAATVIAQAEALELVRRIASTQAMTARATGQWPAERNALDLLAILDAEAVAVDE